MLHLNAQCVLIHPDIPWAEFVFIFILFAILDQKLLLIFSIELHNDINTLAFRMEDLKIPQILFYLLDSFVIPLVDRRSCLKLGIEVMELCLLYAWLFMLFSLQEGLIGFLSLEGNEASCPYADRLPFAKASYHDISMPSIAGL